MKTALVIVAAGRGERFGRADKVLALLGGKPVLNWSLDAAERSVEISDVLVVAGAHSIEPIRELVRTGAWSKVRAVVAGGGRRQGSVSAGIGAIPGAIDVILVHDAARPLVTADLFDACAWAAAEYGASVVATPVVDTLKRAGAEGRVVETVSREGLWAAQTPQGLRLDTWRIIETLMAEGREFTDEASACEAAGIAVRIVEGERINFKITVPEDLLIAEAIVRSAR